MNIIKKYYYRTLYSLLKNNNRMIITENFMKYKNGRIIHTNWGDDINKYFFEYVTNRKVVKIPVSQLGLKNIDNCYCMIGSIISFYNLNGKTIYGSGIIDPTHKINGIPSKIISVRGPKTREVLLNRGINCPEKYGDPALLLPLFYSHPNNTEDYIGIICNMETNVFDVSFINDIKGKYKIKTIDMTSYLDWKDIINEICSCKYILSESLHGLIVAETYSIPNVWVEFREHNINWSFKYLDFYESINKENMKSILVNNEKTFEKALYEASKWFKGDICYDDLLTLFPFEKNNRL